MSKPTAAAAGDGDPPPNIKRVKTEKELGEALKQEPDRIEIEGDLSKKVIKIRATGNVAWGVCIACFAVALTAVLVSGPTPEKAALVAPAAGILGVSTAISAILIGVAAGGVAALTKLRTYKEVSRSDSLLVLAKR